MFFILFFYRISYAAEYPVSSYKLKNGLTVLMRRIPESPVVSVSVIYRVGSRNERSGISGISHLLEHLAEKNTKQYPREKMARILNFIGADFSGFTSNDVTGFYATAAPEYLELLLHMEADRMKNTVINQVDLDNEKKILAAEIKKYKLQPSYLLWLRVRAAAFPSHPYGLPAQGNLEDIAKIKIEQVRWFYKNYYRPENAVISVVGNFNEKKTKTLINKFFSGIKNINAKPVSVKQEPASKAEKRIILTHNGKSTLLHVAFYTPSVKDRDIPALSVIDALLTSGRTSRLKTALADSGKTSGVGAWLDTNMDPGLYYLRLSLKSPTVLEETEKALYAELDRLKNEDISNEELQKAKNQLNAQFLKSRDSNTLQARFLAWYQAIYSYRYLENFKKNIDLVTPGEIKRVAQKYFTEKNRIVGILKPEAENNVNGETPEKPDDREEPSETGFTWKKDPKLSGIFLTFSVAGFSRSKEANSAYFNSAGNKIILAQATKKTTSLQKKPAFKKKKFTVKKPHTKTKAKIKPKLKPKPRHKPYTPPIPEPRSFNLNFKRHVLSNGLTLLINENHTNRTVSVRGYIKAGSMFEPAGKDGLAKMTALLLQRGSRELDAAALSGKLDYLGADMKFNANLQNCEFAVWSASDKIGEVLPLLAQVITAPVFPDDQVSVIRSILTDRSKRAKTDPEIVSSESFYASVFPENHPFHHSEWGSPQTLELITREDVVNFYNSSYRPESTIIAVSGDVNPDEIISCLLYTSPSPRDS